MPTEIEEFTLYRGEVKIEFYPNSHIYKVTDSKFGLDRKRVQSCTGIIGIKDKSAPLVIWATRLAQQHLEAKVLAGQPITITDIREACGLHKVRKEQAATIGDEIHDWIEYFIKAVLEVPGYEIKPTPTKPEVRLGVISFLDWVDAHHVRFISSERVLYSRTGQWIGKMDFEAIIDGKLAMGDWKSSNSLQNTVRLQTAGYATADMEEFNYTNNLVPGEIFLQGEAYIKRGKELPKKLRDEMAKYPSKTKQYQTRWAIRLTKETEKDYHVRMKEKGLADYPDYMAFEAMEFPEVPGEAIADDYIGFDHARGLFLWDRHTDFYYNKVKK